MDFGTDSVRVLLCDSRKGEDISAGVSPYSRWKETLYCDAPSSRYRPHGLDYIESFSKAFRTALAGAYAGAGEVFAAIAIDTTGSSPCPVDNTGAPLCLKEEAEKNIGGSEIALDWFNGRPDSAVSPECLV